MPLINVSKMYTINRYITEQANKHPDATGEFTGLLHDLTFAMRIIASNVRRAGITDVLGLTHNHNVHGEQVRKIDEYANEVIIKALDHSGFLCAMVSEEADEVIPIPNTFKKGKYILAFDPLDGSSNMDVNITIGTIFSLYQRLDPDSNEPGTAKDFLQPGYKQKAAGYVLYGSSTILVYTTGNGVNIFTYDPTIGEFIMIYEKVRIPERGSYFSCNAGNSMKWNKKLQTYFDYLRTPSEDGLRPYSQRYVATVVADVHRMLHYGGIYMYPPEVKKPDGKLRLLYEANPLAMIVEQAGGKATTGKEDIMKIQPTSIHQTVPLFIGSPKDVDEAVSFYNGTHDYLK